MRGFLRFSRTLTTDPSKPKWTFMGKSKFVIDFVNVYVYKPHAICNVNGFN